MRGRDQGGHQQGPLGTIYKPNGATKEYRDQVLNWNPRIRMDDFSEFMGVGRREIVRAPLMWNDTSVGINAILTTDNKAARALLIAPVTGFVRGVNFVGEDTLAANDTNYVTFSVTNRGAGAAATAMLAASDANTTKATGGSAITAKTTRELTLHGTPNNLYVVKGDVIEVQALVAGTLANAVDVPSVQIVFHAIHEPWEALVSRVTAFPLAHPIEGSGGTSIGGGVVIATTSINEAMYAGIYHNNYLTVNPGGGFEFEAKVTGYSSAPGANARIVIGLCSTFNATLDNITRSIWFRLEGSNAILIEGDDNTTDTDDQAAANGETMSWDASVENVFYMDGRDRRAVGMYYNDKKIGTLDVSGMGGGSQLLQPILLAQKDSGTGVTGLNIEYVRVCCNRFS